MFFFNDTATTDIYTYLHTLSLHYASSDLHDLTRPAFDRIGLGAQPAARAGAALGLFAVPFERFAAAARHDEFVAALVEFGADIFHHVRRCRMRSEEHTSELQSLMRISYAVFCLKKKNKKYINT